MLATMKTTLLLLALGIQVVFATGCANTAHGVKEDTHNAAEHVENATK